MRGLIALLFLLAGPVTAEEFPGDIRARMALADVVFLGEIHDNPHHHITQAEVIGWLKPAAIVLEMLSAHEAQRVTPALATNAAALAEALDWANSGWPDFALYAPVFAAHPEARFFGAEVARSEVRRALRDGPAATFGPGAARFGLPDALAEDQQTAREALQMAAHCNALPVEMLPGMVGVQRLRDAALARAVLNALDEAGKPVIVITGNGHARTDWGAPAYLGRVRPGLSVFALGQGEAGAGVEGSFDFVLSAPGVERGDPCAAFD